MLEVVEMTKFHASPVPAVTRAGGPFRLEAAMHDMDQVRTRRAHSARSKGRRAVAGLAASALLALTAIACGGDATGPSGPGTGNMTATGAVSTSGSGLALFQSTSTTGGSLFQLLVAPTSQTTAATWQIQIANYSGRPAAGTYALSPLSASSTNPTANFYYTSGSSIRMFNATSGQLVITSSTSSAVRGTYTFTGVEVNGTSTVAAQGSFDALCAPGMSCQ
jgi:hypothetical protein